MIRRIGPNGIALMALLFGPLAVRGEIGDSREQLQARFGAGKEVGDQLLFSTGPYFVSVYFANNHASMEVYALAPDAKGNSLDWKEDQQQELLKRQAKGQDWLLGKSQKSNESYWVRKDQLVAARFVPDKKIMVFLSMQPDKLGKSK